MRSPPAPRDARDAWLCLALAPGLGLGAAARAVEAAQGPEAALARPLGWWQALLGQGPGARLVEHPARAPVSATLARLEALGATAITPADPGWPAAAFEGVVPRPLALFLRGALPAPGVPGVALVGTRAATPYGLRVARELAEGLARSGVCVWSGLAVGVDSAAHAGALAAARATPATVAVLGCGLGVVYPAESGALREAIAERGALLSEYPPDVPPERWRFPQRNRLVAALAGAVVVVEAPARSGALLTAALAVDLGREVLAVPGPIGRVAHEGTHGLLHAGTARLCRGVGDVLAALGLDAADPGLRPAEPPPPPAGPELALWRLLDVDEARDADALCRASALPPYQVAAALAALELDGRALRLPGVGWLRSPR